MAMQVVATILLIVQAHMVNGTPKTYTAAVVEYETLYATPNGKEFSDLDAPVDKETAINMMMKNVDMYESHTIEAKRHGAQIIIFPENGIHGYEYTRAGVFPFLQHIPDPKSNPKTVIPCDDFEHYGEVPVIRRLSCIAKENEIVVVANLGDVQYCGSAIVSCPQDGRFQYNTDVVFDSDGTFLLKYHKNFLFHEDEYDTPENCSYPTFTPSFGVRFGVVTCFDLMFEKPAMNLVHDLGIRNIAFPTAWPNFYPMMASYAFHQAWSWRNGVNLLAANHHRLTAHMTGSGIYSRGEVKRLYFNHTIGSDGQLLIAELPVLDEEDTPDSALNFDQVSFAGETLRTAIGNEFAEALKGASPHENGFHVHAAKSKEMHPGEGNTEKENKETFKSELLFDQYNFIKLRDQKGNLTICNHEICCNLFYSKEDNTENQEHYALGVYTGVHGNDPVHISVCALVRCANDENNSCGQPVRDAHTTFDSFTLRGNFSEEIVLYPIILIDDARLISPSSDGMHFSGSSLGGVLGKPLVSAFLFGRMYEKDVYLKCRDTVA